MTLQIWLEIIQIALIFFGLIGVGLIPKFFYQRKLDKLSQALNSLNISIEKNHSPKMDAYKQFMQAIYENTKNNSSKTQKAMEASYAELSRIIFLYGSDDAIKSFIRLREYNAIEQEEESKREVVALVAKFMLELRKDLNFGATDVKAEDYLRILLNDWEKSKHHFEKYL
ncbi:hypothetical protein PB01_08570 [Psychrobacillus glaciei]|uniref:DUF4760 domain-containing protein n=1 Tax=Psychrobacillus glaciei TaxID=2283160 RepID=A0A5J6SMD3_9BACI|nr:hypothetical protein [Psychrobacillus glaciei]QFF98882.1 hypothetical protein PB01_08570 [Psychrobacillus glaciei]